LVKTCLRSAESTRWNDRCAPTWSGNSTSILLRYTIFNITSSKISPDQDLISHSPPSTPFTHQSSSNANSSSSSTMPFLAPHVLIPRMLQSSLVHPFLHIPPRVGTSHSIKEARHAPTSPWSPHRARYQRQAERLHVYARSGRDCCKLGYSTPPPSGVTHAPNVFAQSRD